MSYRLMNWRSVSPKWISGALTGTVSKAIAQPFGSQGESQVAAEPAAELASKPAAELDPASGPVAMTEATNRAESAETTPSEAIDLHLEVLRDRDWTWLKVSLFLLAIPATAGTFAYNWLAAVPESTNCQAPNWSQADFERLQCIHQQMQSGETRQVLAGIRQLKAWPEQSSVYTISQRLLEDWSVVVWSQAQVEFEAGEWEQSAKLIAEIPEQIDLWNQAQQRSSLWQEVREQGETLYERAQTAIQAQNWQQAMEHAQALASLDNDYWRKQGLRELPLLIEAEQASLPTTNTDGPVASRPMPGAEAVDHASRPRQSQPVRPHHRAIAPVMVSLSRPVVAEPGMVQPEFSAA